ncbi:MAG TPA: methyltransferase domain-containing protein [Terriglobia bacterium]|nr:methyltransferase domain-containing protein [Terriglobia bacterium]
MEFTGERIIPGKVEPDLYNEHLARYLFSLQFAGGRKVLDLGCGTGYGSKLMAGTASEVFAADVSAEAIHYARENFSAVHLHYLLTDATALSLASNSFDVVLCFEVIEHLAGQEALLEEIRRVLKSDGILIVSTPNRLFYTEERKLVNPYHTREFSFGEFQDLLRKYFGKVEVVYQNHIPSILVGEAGRSLNVRTHFDDDAGQMQFTSNFFVAVCSRTAQAYPDLETLVYLTTTGNLLREKEQRIESLESKLADRERRILQLQSEYDERTQWCLQLDKTVQARDTTILELQQQFEELRKELEERTVWARQLSEENAQKDQHILQLQNDFDERTAWALQLQGEVQVARQQINTIKQSKLYRLSKALNLVPTIEKF